MVVDPKYIKFMQRASSESKAIILQTGIKSDNKIGFMLRTPKDEDLGVYNDKWVSDFRAEIPLSELTTTEIDIVRECADKVDRKYKALILAMINEYEKTSVTIFGSRVFINDYSLFDMEEVRFLEFNKKILEVEFIDGTIKNFCFDEEGKKKLTELYLGNNRGSVTIKS